MKKGSKTENQAALFGLFPGESILSDTGNANVLDNVTKKLKKSREKLVEEIKKQEVKNKKEDNDLNDIKDLLPKIKNTFKSLFTNLNSALKLSEKSITKLTESYQKIKETSLTTKKKRVSSAEKITEPQSVMLRPNIGPMSVLNSVLPVKVRRKKGEKKDSPLGIVKEIQKIQKDINSVAESISKNVSKRDYSGRYLKQIRDTTDKMWEKMKEGKGRKAKSRDDIYGPPKPDSLIVNNQTLDSNTQQVNTKIPIKVVQTSNKDLLDTFTPLLQEILFGVNQLVENSKKGFLSTLFSFFTKSKKSKSQKDTEEAKKRREKKEENENSPLTSLLAIFGPMGKSISTIVSILSFIKENFSIKKLFGILLGAIIGFAIILKAVKEGSDRLLGLNTEQSSDTTPPPPLTQEGAIKLSEKRSAIQQKMKETDDRISNFDLDNSEKEKIDKIRTDKIYPTEEQKIKRIKNAFPTKEKKALDYYNLTKYRFNELPRQMRDLTTIDFNEEESAAESFAPELDKRLTEMFPTLYGAPAKKYKEIQQSSDLLQKLEGFKKPPLPKPEDSNKGKVSSILNAPQTTVAMGGSNNYSMFGGQNRENPLKPIFPGLGNAFA